MRDENSESSDGGFWLGGIVLVLIVAILIYIKKELGVDWDTMLSAGKWLLMALIVGGGTGWLTKDWLSGIVAFLAVALGACIPILDYHANKDVFASGVRWYGSGWLQYPALLVVWSLAVKLAWHRNKRI